MDISNLEYKLRRIKNRELDLIGGDLEVYSLKQDIPIAAYINLHTWDVHIDVNTEWDPFSDKTLAEYLGISNEGIKEEGNEKAVFGLSRDILYHEAKHWSRKNGCPTDLGYHDKVLDGVHRALKEAGKINSSKAREGEIVDGLTAYVANAFEDIIVNSANKLEHPGEYRGIGAFFYAQGKRQPLDPFYEAFARVNMQAWGDKEDKGLAEKVYGNDPVKKGQIEAVVANVANTFKLTDDVKRNVRILSSKDKWGEMAYAYTKMTAHLLDQNKGGKDGEQMATSPSDSDEKGNSKSAQGEGEMEKKMRDEGEMKKIIEGRMKGDKESNAEGGKKGGKARPSYMKSFEFLDTYYGIEASQVVVRAERRRNSYDLPVVEYAFEEFDPDTHTPDQINFRRMIVSGESPFEELTGKPINFEVARENFSLQIPTKLGPRSYPDLCFIVDTSGSMKMGGGEVLNPEADERKRWTDGCNYHYALLGIWGVMKYLQGESIAPYIDWNMINFGDSTLASGWKNYGKIQELKRHALSPQFGGTVIDSSVLEKELGKRDPSLVIALSDGDIQNWSTAKEGTRKVLEGHYVSFIQLGGNSPVGDDMKSWGHVVKNVRGKDDLVDLMIDVTKQKVREIYGR